MDAHEIEAFTKSIPEKIRNKTITEQEFKDLNEAKKQYFQLTKTPLILCLSK